MCSKKVRQMLVGGLLSLAMTGAVLPLGQPLDVSAETAEATSDLRILGLHFDKSYPQAAGTRVTISADCFGGTGDYVYTYTVRLPDGTYETIATDTESASVGYTLSEVGTYNFSVAVSDGTELVSDTKEFIVTPAKVKIDRVKLNKSSFTKNDTLKINISATPSSGTVKSKITVKTPTGTKKTIKGYSTKMSASYKLKKKGTYKITVSVKDSKTSTSTSKTIKVK